MHRPNYLSSLSGDSSYYESTVQRPPIYPSLEHDLTVDVCIVGGGYTGLSTGLHLANKGYSVVILEARRVGFGASGRNGGHVSVGPRQDPIDLVSQVGRSAAKKLWDMSVEASSLVRSLIADYHIDCDYKSGGLHVVAKKSEVDDFRRHVTQLNSEYGYSKLRYVEKDEVDQMLGTTRYFGGQLDAGAAHLHPLKYVLGLAREASNAGVQIHENSSAIGYKALNRVEVSTNRGRVDAKIMVLACNGYLQKLCPKIATYIMPINNFILATEPFSRDDALSLIRDDIAVSDSLFVINYWALSSDNRLLFGGGENYTRRFPADIKKFVRKKMLQVYPQLHQTQIDYAWGGTLAVTMNRMPSVGRVGNNILYAQGYSGHGIPTATYAGKIIAEAIDGYSEDFDTLSDFPVPKFPGGTLLRWPGLAAGMAFYSLRDTFTK